MDTIPYATCIIKESSLIPSYKYIKIKIWSKYTINPLNLLKWRNWLLKFQISAISP